MTRVEEKWKKRNEDTQLGRIEHTHSFSAVLQIHSDFFDFSS